MTNTAEKNVDLDIGRAGIAAIQREWREGRSFGTSGVTFGRIHIGESREDVN
jgi:hypothetical protein